MRRNSLALVKHLLKGMLFFGGTLSWDSPVDSASAVVHHVLGVVMNLMQLLPRTSLKGGGRSCCTNEAFVAKGFALPDEALLSPVLSPGVLDQPVILPRGRVGPVPDGLKIQMYDKLCNAYIPLMIWRFYQHCVSSSASVARGENPARVVLEGLVGVHADGHGTLALAKHVLEAILRAGSCGEILPDLGPVRGNSV